MPSNCPHGRDAEACDDCRLGAIFALTAPLEPDTDEEPPASGRMSMDLVYAALGEDDVFVVTGIRARIFAQVVAERERQTEKYGFPQPLWQYLPILVKEVGEVGEECKWPNRPNLPVEIIQVMAVCAQWLEAMAAQEESSE